MSVECCIGTSGWVYPHWKGIFYPEEVPQGKWFDYYQEHFQTVEINNTFYQLPPSEQFERWRDQAPQGFRYAVKANRYLTHMKKLKDPAEPLQRFLSRVRNLEDTLGPILWQLPPKWHANPDRLESFAQLLPKDLRHVFEFRDPDWFQASIREILVKHKLSFCIFNMVDMDCPEWVIADPIYLRFHGSERAYGGEYGDEGLRPWIERIGKWLTEGHSLYAYFNNDVGGAAIRDAKSLQKMLEGGRYL